MSAAAIDLPCAAGVGEHPRSGAGGRSRRASGTPAEFKAAASALRAAPPAFQATSPSLRDREELEIAGYASLFWTRDLSDDVAAPGAFAASLARGPGRLKMLYQHEARTPVGVWDEAYEDALGLYVRGRILPVSPEGRLAAALVRAGALDGLSIGFRTVRARADDSGRLRVLTEVDVWEVSLVTFPMLPGARLTTPLP